MITSNVIHRTFNLRYKDGTGTAFAIDRDKRQYLITARHVVMGIESGRAIELFHNRQWKEILVTVVGVGTGETDIAVLSCPRRLAPEHPLEPSTKGMVYGQEIYFLGFPFGWNSGREEINRDFPIPFVKSGVVSAFPPGDPSLIYIDAHGNQGFSGGPVVFPVKGGPANELRLAGVVANAPTPSRRPIVDKHGLPLLTDEGHVAYFAENQGFVVAVDIRHAIELIDGNPIGFDLSGEESV